MSGETNAPTLIDLFCGAGGLSAGFEQAGFDAVGAIDADGNAVETWNANHEGTAIHGDITTYTPEQLRDQLALNQQPTVIAGGPPCQDFSKGNQKIDLGRRHLVSLFGEYVRAFEPAAFIMENVRQLTTTHESALERLYETLDGKYTIAHRLLDAADYGVPQHRIRAFVVGVRTDAHAGAQQTRFPQPTHGPDSEGGPPIRAAGPAIADLPSPTDPSRYRVTSEDAPLLDDIPPGMNYSFYTEKRGHPNPRFGWRDRFSDYLYKADPAKPVRTLKAKPGAGSGPFHWDNRRFSEPELKRLQSFPDEFIMDTHGYTTVVEQIGNSVPPRQAAALGRALRQQLASVATETVPLVDAETHLNFRGRKRTSSAEYDQKTEMRLQELGLV
jgi:DNA (cytosine-5)-methyltransferase 1